MTLRIRPLEPTDNRKNFHSGNVELDTFFQRYAGQNHFKHHYGVTYVALDEGQIVGYATVAAGSMATEFAQLLGRRPPGYALPALRLGRLAVDERHQGKGVGGQLLRYVLTQATEMRDRFGCVGVLVDAKPDAVRFYQGYGFAVAPPVGLSGGAAPTLMFLPISAIPLSDDQRIHAEARLNLVAFHASFQTYRQQHGVFPARLVDCGFAPASGERYLYFGNLADVLGGDKLADRAARIEAAATQLRRMNLTPHLDPETFGIVAITAAAESGTFDIWTVDQTGGLVHVSA